MPNKMIPFPYELNSERLQCVKASKLEFSKKCRRVSIKNIPSGVSTQDILELLKPYFYQQIHIDKNSQSCKAVLLDGSSATQCINELNGKKYRGQSLSVSLASCDFMLCVTQLPRTYTHGQFLSLITPFGTPERCFLAYSEITGESKGYGCVEFTSKESSIKAKNQLNGYKIDSNILQVHWLDTIPATYSGLSSLCLLVEDLPAGFNDNSALKRIFSCYAHPKFCQVASCCSGEFAVVEYQNPIDCEKTWSSLDGHKIGNSPINVSFCVPGPCGLVVLNSLKASREMKSANPTGGLLPTPVLDPAPKVATSFPSIYQNKLVKDTMPPSGSEDMQINSADIRVQRLINSLHGHTIEKTSGQDYPSWSQAPQSTFPKHSQKPLEMRKPQPGHFTPSATNRITPCDKIDDEVFEIGRRCKEESQSMPPIQEDSRPTNNFDATLHHFVPHGAALAPYMFLREDSQRSDSSDSAYGGSQGSSSETPCHVAKDMLVTGSSGNVQHAETARENGQIYPTRPDIHGRKFPPSHLLDRNRAEWESRTSVGESYQTTSQIPSGRFSPYKIHNKAQTLPSNYARPCVGRGVTAFDVYQRSGACGPVFLGPNEITDRDAEIIRLCTTSRSPSNRSHLGVDSPTQLRLLGSNLMEGLLGDSPRSHGDDVERGRRINALNLLSSPTNGSYHACTPTSVRRDHLLPSPEPSPEAGAYVGQHSQGLGGHYADSCRFLRRRRSNEI